MKNIWIITAIFVASLASAETIHCLVQDYEVQAQQLVKKGPRRKVEGVGKGAGWYYARGASKVSPSVKFEGAAYGGRTSSTTKITDEETDFVSEENVTVGDGSGSAAERAEHDGKIYYEFLKPRRNGNPGAILVECSRDD